MLFLFIFKNMLFWWFWSIFMWVFHDFGWFIANRIRICIIDMIRIRVAKTIWLQWWIKPGSLGAGLPLGRYSQTIFRVLQTIFRISQTILRISQTGSQVLSITVVRSFWPPWSGSYQLCRSGSGSHFRSTNSIPSVWANTMFVVNTISPCL